MPGVKGPAVNVTASQVARLLKGLFDAVMAAATQRLPITLIPEFGPVAAMRLDMVHDGGRRDASDVGAQGAARMQGKVPASCLLPARPVQTGHIESTIN